MTDSLVRQPGRGRRAWEQHGSKMILAIIVLTTWIVSAEWNDRKNQIIVADIVSSTERQMTDMRARLRVVHDNNMKLAADLAVAQGKTGAALDKATDVVRKADTVLEEIKKSTSEEPKK